MDCSNGRAEVTTARAARTKSVLNALILMLVVVNTETERSRGEEMKGAHFLEMLHYLKH